jgi:hypothetical protein
MGGDNNLYAVQDSIPYALLAPTINIIGTCEEPHSNGWKLLAYDLKLLLAQRHLWCQEPDKLPRRAIKLCHNTENRDVSLPATGIHLRHIQNVECDSSGISYGDNDILLQAHL